MEGSKPEDKLIAHFSKLLVFFDHKKGDVIAYEIVNDKETFYDIAFQWSQELINLTCDYCLETKKMVSEEQRKMIPKLYEDKQKAFYSKVDLFAYIHSTLQEAFVRQFEVEKVKLKSRIGQSVVNPIVENQNFSYKNSNQMVQVQKKYDFEQEKRAEPIPKSSNSEFGNFFTFQKQVQQNTGQQQLDLQHLKNQHKQQQMSLKQNDRPFGNQPTKKINEESRHQSFSNQISSQYTNEINSTSSNSSQNVQQRQGFGFLIADQQYKREDFVPILHYYFDISTRQVREERKQEPSQVMNEKMPAFQQSSRVQGNDSYIEQYLNKPLSSQPNQQLNQFQFSNQKDNKADFSNQLCSQPDLFSSGIDVKDGQPSIDISNQIAANQNLSKSNLPDNQNDITINSNDIRRRNLRKQMQYETESQCDDDSQNESITSSVNQSMYSNKSYASMISNPNMKSTSSSKSFSQDGKQLLNQVKHKMKTVSFKTTESGTLMDYEKMQIVQLLEQEINAWVFYQWYEQNITVEGLCFNISGKTIVVSQTSLQRQEKSEKRQYKKIEGNDFIKLLKANSLHKDWLVYNEP